MTATGTPRRVTILLAATPTKAGKDSETGHEDLTACWNFSLYSWIAETESVAETAKEGANQSSSERVVGNWRHLRVKGICWWLVWVEVVGMEEKRLKQAKKAKQCRLLGGLTDQDRFLLVGVQDG